MAQMIPETIPSTASAGEKRLFALLEKLPQDCIVYYEPRVSQRNPDFIVIVPQFGVLIIEVKGWYPAWIVRGDNNDIVIRKENHEEIQKHPTRQAKEYKFALMDHCKRHLKIAGELFEVETGRLAFPFSHCCVLSNMTVNALERINGQTLFPAEECVTRDALQKWESRTDSTTLLEELRSYFRPMWKFPPLSGRRLIRLRALIHPEIIIQSSAAYEDLQVLDLQQERNARSIGNGHRIVFGVAGSGKTVLLVARAKLLSQQNPKARILVLCYNVTLRSYLSECLRECPSVTVQNFHRWAMKARRDGETDVEALGQRWLDLLQRRATPEAGRYDAVLIDEGQDFVPIWFRCVVAALRNPEESDLLIVHDGSQGLYGEYGVRWKEVGIRAAGRTVHNDLEKNYRNTREILQLAQRFAKKTTQPADSDSADHVVPVDPENCHRSFHPPVQLQFPGRDDEIAAVHNIIRQLTSGTFTPFPGYKVPPSAIAVLYRVRPFSRAFDRLTADPDITWLSRDGDRNARTLVNDGNTKLLTIHAAKGLQFRVVILMCCDTMPSTYPDTTPAVERSLQYVALTRSEELLILTHSKSSDFTEEVAESQLATQMDWVDCFRSGQAV